MQPAFLRALGRSCHPGGKSTTVLGSCDFSIQHTTREYRTPSHPSHIVMPSDRAPPFSCVLLSPQTSCSSCNTTLPPSSYPALTYSFNHFLAHFWPCFIAYPTQSYLERKPVSHAFVRSHSVLHRQKLPQNCSYRRSVTHLSSSEEHHGSARREDKVYRGPQPSWRATAARLLMASQQSSQSLHCLHRRIRRNLSVPVLCVRRYASRQQSPGR